MESNSLSYLLPSVGEIFSGTPAGVSALIWIVMYCFAMYAGNYVISRYLKGRKTVALLKDFKEKLDESIEEAQTMADDLREERATRTMGLLLRDLLGNLTENPSYTGADTGAGSARYISTTQLGYYLNTRDLVPDLFDNKFISFVPSLLTGFGVLGTFIGIQLGIGGLDFKVDDIENVTNSITMLLAGSTVAFMTSIWGVFFSLVFSVGEKTLIRKLQFNFQDREYEIGRQIQFVSPENEIVLLRKTNDQIVVYMQTLTAKVSNLDFPGLAGMIGQEMKTVLETTPLNTSDAGSNEMLEELGSIIVSELRFIKEAAESGKSSGPSLVNLR